MLTDKIQRISAETQAVKQEIHNAIAAQTPPKVSPWFAVIKISELENFILSASYYNTGAQLRRLSDYVIGSAERSLETILKTFNAVVEHGKAPAFKDDPFNSKTRAIVKELL